MKLLSDTFRTDLQTLTVHMGLGSKFKYAM